jgi:hypothetical protein
MTRQTNFNEAVMSSAVHRDKRILDAAYSLAQAGNLMTMTRGHVAAGAGVAVGTVSNYGRTSLASSTYPPEGIMAVLREAVLREAVVRGDLALIRQGLAARHPVALEAPEQLRMAALLD